MRTIRASELGTWLYCQRAWWYQRQGAESSNRQVMEAGTDEHRQHTINVANARLLQFAGWAFLLGALVLLAILLTKIILV